MYYSRTVRVPDIPGKVFIEERGETLVYYETESGYDPLLKCNSAKRMLVGKLSEDNPGRMYPNESYWTEFIRLRMGALRVGTFAVVDRIVRECGLGRLLEEIFGEGSDAILDVLCYRIVDEGSAGQRFEDYARTHPLFHGGMAGGGGPGGARPLSRITEGRIAAFLDAWNEGLDGRRVLISHASADRYVRAHAPDFFREGRACAGEASVAALSLAFDAANRVPLFYEEYPVPARDVDRLRYLTHKARGRDARDIVFVLDEGTFDRESASYLDGEGLAFLVAAWGGSPLAARLVAENTGTFECERSCRIPGTGLYGTTVEGRLYEGEDRTRCFHLYFDAARHARDRTRLEGMLERMAAELQAVEDMEYVVGEPYTRFFKCAYSKRGAGRIFRGARENVEAITGAIRFCGYFCLITSERMTAEEAWGLYRGRDMSERLFRDDRFLLDTGSLRAPSNEVVSAGIFIDFLTLIVHNHIYSTIDDTRFGLNTEASRMTVRGAVRELERIEMTEKEDASYGFGSEFSEEQKKLIRAFGLTSEDILEMVNRNLAERA